MSVHLHAVPYLTRRARLIMGMTQSEFAEMFGVDDGTVSRWERGKLHPSPEAWKRIRTITIRATSFTSDELVKASPVCKYVSPMNDLLNPCVISRGAGEALKRTGTSPTELFRQLKEDTYKETPDYPNSAAHALEIIQSDPRWLKGFIVYAEARCISATLGGEWANLMVAPIPDRSEALMELVLCTEEGAHFWVHLVDADELNITQPSE